MTDEQLQAIEQVMNRAPNFDTIYARNAIRALIADVRDLKEDCKKYYDALITEHNTRVQLEKEAQYLAEQCVRLYDDVYQEVAVEDWRNDPEMKPSYWREEAKKATEQ